MFKEDPWLAGFAAGEGTFVMNPKRDRDTCTPVFRILKQRDYLIWRRAVEIYCDRGERGGASDLLALKEALEAGRVFQADEPEMPETNIHQLRLLEDESA